ncbi:uncharacterized protein LOC105841299 [Bombyx mori]|uniref:Uncharacterized protein n=1 Tax=Bombyx mori TaxID=7091 RepID=A0A8R2DKA0_BOMMO|nr:uncharacterized protein LOC105841299 [Bombyx mori]
MKYFTINSPTTTTALFVFFVLHNLNIARSAVPIDIVTIKYSSNKETGHSIIPDIPQYKPLISRRQNIQDYLSDYDQPLAKDYGPYYNYEDRFHRLKHLRPRGSPVAFGTDLAARQILPIIRDMLFGRRTTRRF